MALVGEPPEDPQLTRVGPQRRLPSGGLIAMGNFRNIVYDLRAGLLTLTFAQWTYLRSQRFRYDRCVAVGDTYALFMALQVSTKPIYIGTAKSVYVARYGPGERRLLRKARSIFVRDEATAQDLRDHQVSAESLGNVISDLYDAHDANPPLAGAPRLLLLPGSREDAYAHAVDLVQIVARLAPDFREMGVILSLAPGLHVPTLLEALAKAGIRAEHSNQDTQVPLVIPLLSPGMIYVWRGSLGAAIHRATLVFGQAGTANEAAAAAGVPIVAYDASRGEHSWYRMRQRGLLGDAVVLVRGDYDSAASQVGSLLRDGQKLAQMSAIGRARMGSPGASHRIALRVLEDLTT